jgi:tRNA1Val (adenine37-N6)-methyltransferase
MSDPFFRFKKFSVRHRDSAMKVGVDGVLLGAWAAAENPKRILDIGSGTGLIALMLAQRFEDAEITAVEINRSAFEESEFNFKNSPFANRMKAVNLPIQEFNDENKFDLIVSNPPYFEPNHDDGTDRSLARQKSELSFEELSESVERFIGPNGNFGLILPYESENNFIQIASKNLLFPKKITRVRGNPQAEVKRSLITFSKTESKIEIDELTIEQSRNVYTEEYIGLTKEFYLKM